MQRMRPYSHWRVPFCLALGLLTLLMAVGCSSRPTDPATRPPSTLATISYVRPPEPITLTLGDVDADEPTKKVQRLQPLARHLEQSLQDLGVTDVRVVIASSRAEMAQFMKEGKVDVYFDSAFPTLKVQEGSGSKILLRRWKGGDPEYWSVYLVRRDSGITQVEDLVGAILAVEEPNSTSGFILPVGSLIELGHSVREVSGPTASVGPDEIGYFFTRDEQNTVELVMQNRVAAGGVSNQDYEKLPPEIKAQVITFGRTISVPRQLVSVQPNLDPEIEARISQILTDLDQHTIGLEILDNLKKTKKFDALPDESRESLTQLGTLIDLVSESP